MFASAGTPLTCRFVLRLFMFYQCNMIIGGDMCIGSCWGYVLFEDVIFSVSSLNIFISKFEGLCYLHISNPRGIP